jgi:hypothetical protein
LHHLQADGRQVVPERCPFGADLHVVLERRDRANRGAATVGVCAPVGRGVSVQTGGVELDREGVRAASVGIEDVENVAAVLQHAVGDDDCVGALHDGSFVN